MKSIISYISVFCIVLTFCIPEEWYRNKDHLVLDTTKAHITSLDPAFPKYSPNFNIFANAPAIIACI
jgi:hypothetical protein